MPKDGRPERVRIEELHEAVDRAVGLAAERAELDPEAFVPGSFGTDFHRIPWSIIGRILREELELEAAHRAAVGITENVGETLGLHLSPATTIIDKQILIGFVEQIEQGGGLPVSIGGR
jgi:hypothetical protein